MSCSGRLHNVKLHEKTVHIMSIHTLGSSLDMEILRNWKELHFFPPLFLERVLKARKSRCHGKKQHRTTGRNCKDAGRAGPDAEHKLGDKDDCSI